MAAPPRGRSDLFGREEAVVGEYEVSTAESLAQSLALGLCAALLLKERADTVAHLLNLILSRAEEQPQHVLNSPRTPSSSAVIQSRF